MRNFLKISLMAIAFLLATPITAFGQQNEGADEKIISTDDCGYNGCVMQMSAVDRDAIVLQDQGQHYQGMAYGAGHVGDHSWAIFRDRSTVVDIEGNAGNGHLAIWRVESNLEQTQRYADRELLDRLFDAGTHFEGQDHRGVDARASGEGNHYTGTTALYTVAGENTGLDWGTVGGLLLGQAIVGQVNL